MNNKLAIFTVAIVIGALFLGLYGFIKAGQDYYRATTPYYEQNIKEYSYYSDEGYLIRVRNEDVCAVFHDLSVCSFERRDEVDTFALEAELSKLIKKKYGYTDTLFDDYFRNKSRNASNIFSPAPIKNISDYSFKIATDEVLIMVMQNPYANAYNNILDKNATVEKTHLPEQHNDGSELSAWNYMGTVK